LALQVYPHRWLTNAAGGVPTTITSSWCLFNSARRLFALAFEAGYCAGTTRGRNLAPHGVKLSPLVLAWPGYPQVPLPIRHLHTAKSLNTAKTLNDEDAKYD
jgi:hypothetical protein